MTTLPLRRILFAILVLALVPFARAAEAAPEIVPLGNDTYRVTVSATHKFTRNTEKLRAAATNAATEFCVHQGKHLKIVSVEDSKPMYLVGAMASTTLTFKATDLNDAAAAPVASAPVAPEVVTTTSGSEAMYADLLRLDELRKKGILSDDEFKAEKKKVLDRSK